MLGCVFSGTLRGVEGYMVRVEADTGRGLPYFEMVGFLASEVKEARERVRAALCNSGVQMPSLRMTVSLSPANLRKSGNHFDLPIAAAVLLALGEGSREEMGNTFVLGELGLDGTVRPVQGVLPLVSAAKAAGFSRCLVPEENCREAGMAEGIQIFPVKHLKELMEFLKKGWAEGRPWTGREEQETAFRGPDFSEISGQRVMRRATEIAAAGMHNILYVGPPGAGKSMTAKRIPGILPKMTREECLELTKIYSACGLLKNQGGLVRSRPFRAPHHTISRQAMVGGGRDPRPGEISLAHRGVLFLDELPEFRSEVLESLRQPMEEGKVVLSRVYGRFVFPARAMIAAAMNPCRCGYFPDRRKCSCSEESVNRYLRKISRPFLDRMDMSLTVERPAFRDMAECGGNESSGEIRKRVERCRKIQEERYEKEQGILFNSQLDGAGLRKYCFLETEERRLMEKLYDQLELSARAYGKILKVSRTIADLEGDERIRTRHLYEAVSYRTAEDRIWGGQNE